MNIVVGLYLINLINNLDQALSVVMIGCGIAVILSVILISINNSEHRQDSKIPYTLPIRLAIAAGVCLFLSVLLPSQKTMYLMAGAIVGQEVINNKQVSENLDKVNKIISDKLNSYLESPKKQETK